MDNLKTKLIDNYLRITPSLSQYRGMSIGQTFSILNEKRELDDCEDVKTLVKYFMINIPGLLSCSDFEYVRLIKSNDYRPKY